MAVVAGFITGNRRFRQAATTVRSRGGLCMFDDRDPEIVLSDLNGSHVEA
ncbi:MAG: hypothetical protein AB7T07_04515 [Steroidobacteraceae bacterium]